MFNHLQTENKCQTEEKTLVFYTGRALQISPTALQNRRTSAVLTNSTLTAKPMNNEKRNFQAKWALLSDSTVMANPMNNETCRTEQGSDRKLARQSRAGEL